MDQRLAPDKTLSSYKRREEIGKLAKVERLQPYADVSIIENFAEKFHLDPDYVYAEKDFDTVMMFAIKWKEEDEYQERYRTIEKMMTESANPK